jgi:TRAP-type mannitol/chloroaromatic compound transport system substrate-binding protein
MRIRKFMTAALIGAAALIACTPVVEAQDKKVRLQIAGAYPSTLAIIGQGQLFTTERIRKMSGGSLDAKFFEPGALVPPSQYFDAVGGGSLDSAWSSLGFFTGKEIAFALYSTVPFGPEVGEFLGWMKHGGGEKLMQETASKYKIVAMNCGIVAPESSGWFRKEIKTLDDLKGLKMRFFGLGANVMQKLGVSTQLLQAGEIFQALQLGTIDATEFSMPLLDLNLGFHQVAKHYYFPGWHQMASFTHLMIGEDKWKSMSEAQQEIVKAACDATMIQSYADGEARNADALKQIKTKGVSVHYWPKEVLEAFRKAWDEVAVEQSAKSPEFKKAWESLTAFRNEYKVWRDNAYLKE